MELKPIRCTTCGTQLDVYPNDFQQKCKSCGNTYVVDIAAQLFNKKDIDSTRLLNLRKNLENSISINDLNHIEELSREILIMIPEDFTAQYYNAYAVSKLTSPKLLHSFLQGSNYKATDEEVHKIILHLSNNMDLRDRKLVNDFIHNNYSWMESLYLNVFQKRVKEEDNYAPIKRDIFISHRSTDKYTVRDIVSRLENDGHTCWVSYRNLRPNDNEDYWSNIEEAMEQCSIFLVVSSQDAMLSKDIQKELKMASYMNIKRLEYKIDTSEHTSLFKQFFDGIKWVDGISYKGLDLLKERVFQLKSKIDVIKEREIKQSPSKQKESIIQVPKTEEQTITEKLINSYYGIGVYVDYKNLAIELKKHQETNKEARRLLGLLHLYGKGVKRDYDLARSLLESSLNDGSLHAYADLGRYYFDIKNLNENRKYLTKALEAYEHIDLDANHEALYYKGITVLESGNMNAKNEAFEYFTKSSELGNKQAMYMLSIMYDSGSGVQKDKKKAVELLKIVCGHGVEEAKLVLAQRYFTGNGVVPNNTKGFKLIEEAANNGTGPAYISLATFYYSGTLVNKDKKEAKRLLKLAEQLGFGSAKDNMKKFKTGTL